MDQSEVRGHALDQAVELVVRRSLNPDQVLRYATDFYRWLVGPASVTLAYGPIRVQGSNENTGKDGSSMAQIHDDEEFDVELSAADAKGADVSDDPGTTTDDPTFTSDNEDVFTYRLDPDNPRKATVVGGLPGSATGTITLGTITATHAVDVVPAGVATVSITEGTVRKQGA